MRQTPVVIEFAAAGLGLHHAEVRLVVADEAWSAIAAVLAADIGAALGDVAPAVEHIGSTAVPGLLAKPILDLAIGLRPGTVLEQVEGPLSELEWIYRGDAGDAGGWVFVLEDAPWHRVAHAHGVELGGRQWVRYLQFRDLLRTSAHARHEYEGTKQRLARDHPDSRAQYTSGKDATVEQLLAPN